MSDTATLPFSVTARAAAKINAILAKEAPGAMLRVAVSGGGCSGFQYGFSFDDAKTDDDLLIERDGARVLIDSVSLELLKDSELDWVDELIGASFQIRNPNAKSSCGCGTSFSV
ncbi:MAG TPA: iron-sulfur cluster insertion protein ErpA [Micropepsaceae bacterium]|nr:iron-sulfur cluster insertion protein ErpA [Micropepsaceae bacterium]